MCGDDYCGPPPCEPPYWKPGVAYVSLHVPATVRPAGADLQWSGSAGQYFRGYEVHRGESANFIPTGATLLASFDDPTVSSYNDTSGSPEEPAFYKVVLLTSCGTLPSNEQDVLLPPTGQTTRVIQTTTSPIAATTILASGADPTSTCRNAGGDSALYLGANSNTVYRVLLQFDLASIPTGATVSDAAVLLDVVSASSERATVVSHAMTAPWQEGSGTLATSACTGGASWQSGGTVNWSTPGGDTDLGLERARYRRS